MKKTEKRIEKKELMKMQKHRWLGRGRAGRRKGYTEYAVLHAMTVSAVLCMSQQLQFSSSSKGFSPFTVWLVRAAVAVGTKFKKAA